MLKLPSSAGIADASACTPPHQRPSPRALGTGRYTSRKSRHLSQLFHYLGERLEARSFAEACRRNAILGIHDQIAAN